MVLPQSGNPISLLNIQLEYDDSGSASLSEFYGEGQAPASGTIDLADFYQPASTNAVTSGLLFELDARDSSSYSGNGATTWYDTTSNNRDFSLVNGPTGTSTEVVFDGTNDYAQLSDASWIPDDHDPFSFECYAKIHNMSPSSHNASLRCFISKTSPSNTHFQCGLDETSSGIEMCFSGSAGANADEKHVIESSAANFEGDYHHFVYTYDGDRCRMYYDGSLVYTSGTGKDFGDNTAPLRLMALDPSNGSWGLWTDGEMRVARMYNTALSAANVTTNYANCTGGISPSASTLSVTPSAHTGSAFTATFTFDQNVGDFVTGDITVSGGSKGTFTAVSKKVYTLSITPSSSTSTVSISVGTGASINAGNLGNNSVSTSVVYSTYPTSGLYMDLNANDSSSYGGSGTTWSDLTSNNNDWTLQNGMNYVSSSPKHFNLDGSNDWATRSFSVSSTTDTTWIVWHRPDGNQNSWSALLGFRYGTGSTNILGFKNSNEYQYHWNGSFWGTSTGLTISANRWEMISLRINSTSSKWDQKYSTTTNNFTNTASHGTFSHSGSSGYIGRDPESSGRIYGGDIARISVWTRRLSDTEVNSVYTSTKGTFGY